jgi:methylated-DNA-[protein]-cysteine S-methyltransferase
VVVSPRGVCRVGFPEESHDASLLRVASIMGPRVVRSVELTKELGDRLVAYLEGEPDELDMPVDLSLMQNEFGRRVLETLTETVGRGSVTTYGALAQRIGHPRAARATGTALGRNPIPIVVPCHRVVPGSGGVGNYGGGPDVKRLLLGLEGSLASVRRGGKAPGFDS